MFARTFAVRAKGVNLDDPAAVIDFIERGLRSDLIGRRPFKFLLFADADKENEKVVFYDMSTLQHTIEFSSLLGRLPQFSVQCYPPKISIYHFHEERAIARILDLEGWVNTGKVEGVIPSLKESADESKAVRDVASLTNGFLDTAVELTGQVVAKVFENEHTKQPFPFFTIKLDAKSQDNRAVVRSCEKMYFAWSDTETNYMILVCRFKMLPPYAMMFPISGKSMAKAAELYMKTKKGVGVAIFNDDVNDSFKIEDSKPIFESQEENG